MRISRYISVVVILLTAACSKQNPVAEETTEPQHYTLTGSVIVADPGRGVLTVKYNAVPGVTEAGAGDFRADDATIAAARPGVRFTAQVVKKRGAKWLQNLRSGSQ